MQLDRRKQPGGQAFVPTLHLATGTALMHPPARARIHQPLARAHTLGCPHCCYSCRCHCCYCCCRLYRCLGRERVPPTAPPLSGARRGTAGGRRAQGRLEACGVGWRSGLVTRQCCLRITQPSSKQCHSVQLTRSERMRPRTWARGTSRTRSTSPPRH
jgi:hypothetical protein